MLNPRNIVIFLFLFGTFLVGYFGALGKWNDIGGRQVEILQAEARVRVTQQDLLHNRQLSEFYDDLSQTDRNRVISALPEDTDLPNLLVHIDRLAKESGVLLSNFTIREAAAPTGFFAEEEVATTPSSLLSFRAKGAYTSAKEFLRSLEKFLRIVDIDTILLSSIDIPEDGSEPLLDITLTARTYEFKDAF